MPRRSRKPPRETNITSRFLTGRLEDDPLDSSERFSDRSAGHTQQKIERTALLRAAESPAIAADIDALPVGQVIQVYSLFCNVESQNTVYLCVIRKTLSKLNETAIVVGDHVRFRETGMTDESGRPEAVIEQLLPRKSILCRADSFKAMEQHPIVANADQMLIVAALREPTPKWGLIDRMLVAAQAGHLKPIVCLNKIDLARGEDDPVWMQARQILAHYQSLNIQTLQTSINTGQDFENLRNILANKTTVLAGHSGTGKSSLLRAIQPGLDIRIGAISGYTGKGKHTTTSARRYPLEAGGHVIDTPGVKLFALWNLSSENLEDYFQDIKAGNAPDWRRESYERIRESL